MSDEEAVVSEEEGRQDVRGTDEKLVPVVEAIRYRRRARAAEKELAELKEVHEKQGKELAELKGKAEGGQKDTPSPANAGTGPLQGESFLKTQGVKETRTGGARGKLQSAARRAAESGRRVDLQEYLRARRAFV